MLIFAGKPEHSGDEFADFRKEIQENVKVKRLIYSLK